MPLSWQDKLGAVPDTLGQRKGGLNRPAGSAFWPESSCDKNQHEGRMTCKHSGLRAHAAGRWRFDHLGEEPAGHSSSELPCTVPQGRTFSSCAATAFPLSSAVYLGTQRHVDPAHSKSLLEELSLRLLSLQLSFSSLLLSITCLCYGMPSSSMTYHACWGLPRNLEAPAHTTCSLLYLSSSSVVFLSSHLFLHSCFQNLASAS